MQENKDIKQLDVYIDKEGNAYIEGKTPEESESIIKNFIEKSDED